MDVKLMMMMMMMMTVGRHEDGGGSHLRTPGSARANHTNQISITTYEILVLDNTIILIFDQDVEFRLKYSIKT